MRVVIDRFENDKAVVEMPDKTMLIVPKALFKDAKEGDCVTITVEEKQTDTTSIFEKLRNKNK